MTKTEIKKEAPAPKMVTVKDTPDIYEKIFNVQQAVGMATKGGNNEFNKYKYAREIDIIDVVKPQLGLQRLLVTSTTLSHEINDKQKKVTVQFTLTDIDNKTSIAATFIGEGEDKSGSIVGTPIAYTMALKYFFAKMFIVGTGDDAEVEKRKKSDVSNETPEVKFDKAMKMVAKIKDRAILMQYSEKIAESKTFSKEQLAKLQSAINSRVYQLDANQDTAGK